MNHFLQANRENHPLPNYSCVICRRQLTKEEAEYLKMKVCIEYTRIHTQQHNKGHVLHISRAAAGRHDSVLKWENRKKNVVDHLRLIAK